MKIIPRLAKGGIINSSQYFYVKEKGDGILIPIVISRKRFIKLLMSKGFQRNEAIKIHQEYIKKYKYRTKFSLDMYLLRRNKNV